MPTKAQGDMVVSARNVTLRLGQGMAEVEILKGIDLDVGAGERLAILGPSGSGKSSLMACLSGLEPATSGAIEVAGERLDGRSEDALARMRLGRVGIVLQEFHLIPTMTAIENVAVPLELAGRADAFDVAALELQAVGVGHRTGHYPAQLSGGEQQRVALARALAPRPALLFADEPTGNLDTATSEAVMDLLFRRLDETAATLILITHDRDLARRCSRIIHMQDGRIHSDELLPA